MSRWTPQTYLPVPPVVGQRIALLPDGSIDPAALTDCGESCVSSVLQLATSYSIAPGCIRSAIGLPWDNGRSTTDELASFLTSMGVRSWVYASDANGAWAHLAHGRHYGYMRIILGRWIDTGHLHYMVAYERSSSVIECMDPWIGDYRSISVEAFLTRYQGEQVVANLWA